MSSWNRDRAEVERFLNARDALRSRRRKSHHLDAAAYHSTETVWSVTLCARHHREPFADHALAEPAVDALRFYRDQGYCRVFAFCLMPDHLHAIVQLVGLPSDPDRCRVDLPTLLGRFNRFTTAQIAWKHGLPGPLWQRDF